MIYNSSWLRIGESVIVIKKNSSKYNEIGDVWKVAKRSTGLKISVSFDGEVYNFDKDELEPA